MSNRGGFDGSVKYFTVLTMRIAMRAINHQLKTGARMLQQIFEGQRKSQQFPEVAVTEATTTAGATTANIYL